MRPAWRWKDAKHFLLVNSFLFVLCSCNFVQCMSKERKDQLKEEARDMVSSYFLNYSVVSDQHHLFELYRDVLYCQKIVYYFLCFTSSTMDTTLTWTMHTQQMSLCHSVAKVDGGAQNMAEET